MKHLILLGDGMADFPLPELGNRTPLDAAQTPAMDAAARQGICGLFCPIPDGLPPGSDVGNLSVFGYDPAHTYTGRAPIEAASRGIPLAPGDLAFRCNLVTLTGTGAMESFTAGHITSEEGVDIVETLNETLAQFPIRFHNGVGYRHLGIMTPSPASYDDLASAECTPPHNIAGEDTAQYLPKGTGAGILRDIITASQGVLAHHPVNEKRRAGGQLPATSIWLWGQGRTPRLQSYRDRFGISGSVVSAVDLVKGIGVLAGLEVLNVPGATGYLDTDYEGKVAAALDSLERHDFTYIHIEAPDETAHEGRADLKIRAIEDFDSRVVAPCLSYLHSHPDTRILICPDHVTAVSTKAHAPGPVPFILCGAGVESNGIAAYSEQAAKSSGLLIAAGHTLTHRLLGSGSISAGILAA